MLREGSHRLSQARESSSHPHTLQTTSSQHLYNSIIFLNKSNSHDVLLAMRVLLIPALAIASTHADYSEMCAVGIFMSRIRTIVKVLSVVSNRSGSFAAQSSQKEQRTRVKHGLDRHCGRAQPLRLWVEHTEEHFIVIGTSIAISTFTFGVSCW